MEISKLVEDNQKLVKLAQDNERTIKSLENDRIKLISKNDEISFDLKNTNGKLKSKEENLSYTQKLLEDCKSANTKLQNTLKDYENQIDLLRSDVSNLNSNLQKERGNRMEADKTIDKLQLCINDRDREINRYVTDLDVSRQNNTRLSEENFVISSENEKLKNHIMILTEQNQKVFLFI